jgi:serine/threonine protein kinase
MRRLLKRLQLDNIKYKKDTFHVFKQLNGNSGTSFIYRNLKKKRIFVKFLIAPRNETELNKFKNEINLYKYTNNIIQTTPRLLRELQKKDNYPIYYYISEWVEGKLLKDIIKDKNGQFSLDESIDIVHRCSSKVAYLNSWIVHRDFHPGNIIFLNETPNWEDKFNFIDSKVIITDFGNALMPLAYGMPGGEGLDFIDVKNNLDRRIEGSFKSLGPEIFQNPFESYLNNPGKSESWPLGILLFKLLMNKDIIEDNTLSYYSKLFHHQELQKIVDEKILELELKIKNKTIPYLLNRMLCVDINKRISTASIAKVLWKYRFNNLENNIYSYIKETIDNNGNEDSDEIIDPY